MTEWSNLQWLSVGVGVVLGLVNLGWILTQGRRLHREERARKNLEAGALLLVDTLPGDGTYMTVPDGLRSAALLAQEWGAIDVMWHKGHMDARQKLAGA